MDFVSLVSSSVPAYFVLGPLVIVVITLVVFAAHKASSSSAVIVPTTPQTAAVLPSVVPVAVQGISSTPVIPVAVAAPLSVIPQPVPVPQPVSVENPVVEAQRSTLSPQPTPEPTAVQTAVPLLVPEQPVGSLVVETEPQVSPLEATPIVSSSEKVVTLEQIPVPQAPMLTSIPTGVIPPVSSWKPSGPVVASVDPTHTETQLQVEALASATPTTESIISTPVSTQ